MFQGPEGGVVPHVDQRLQPGQVLELGDVLRAQRLGQHLLLWQRQADDTVQLLRVVDFFAATSDARVQINAGEADAQVLSAQTAVEVSGLSWVSADGREEAAEAADAQAPRVGGGGDVLWQQLLASDMVQVDAVWQPLGGAQPTSATALSGVYEAVAPLQAVQEVQWGQDVLSARAVDVRAPQLTMLPIEAMADGHIQYLEALAGVRLAGQAEAGLHIRVELSQGDRVMLREVQADGNGDWQLTLGQADWFDAQAQSVFADGQVQLRVQTVDGAGNVAQQQQVLDVRLQPPAAPTVQLSAESQTGQAGWSADATPGFEGQVPAGTRVLWGEDLNGDGVLQSAEQQVVSVGADGRFALSSPPLADGLHTWLAQTQDAWGNRSQVVSVQLQVDTVAQQLTLDQQAQLQGARLLHQDVLEGLSLSGTGEPNQSVSLELSNAQGQSLTAQVQADGSGRWSAHFGLAPLSSLGSGPVQLALTGTDVAGNEARVDAGGLSLGLELQILTPRAPTAQLQTTGSSDSVINDTTPTYSGTGPAKGQVRWVRDVNGNGQIDEAEWSQAVLAPVDASGHYSITLPELQDGDGAYNWLVQSLDVYGNVSETALSTGFVLDTQAPPQAQLQAISGDDMLSYQDVRQPNGHVLSGTAEAGAQVTLQLIQGERTQTFRIDVQEDGQWQQAIARETWAAFADGQVQVRVVVTDVAGNEAPALARSVPIRTSALEAVSALSLEAGQDTGWSATDGITSVNQPLLRVSGQPNQWVRFIQDLNRDGSVDAQDAVLGVVQLDGFGRASWQPTQALGEGLQQILALGWEPQTGSYSNVDVLTGLPQAVSARVSLTVDTVAPAAPSMSVVAGDDLVIDSEAALGVQLSGSAEALALVQLTWSRGFGPMSVRADETGRWSLSLSDQALAQLGDGEVSVSLRQTDVAGNVGSQSSTHVFRVDTGALPAPYQLALRSSDDSGRSDSDGITQVQQAHVRGQAMAGQEITVFVDANDNGVLDQGEWSALTLSDEQGQFEQAVSLSEGRNVVRAWASDLSSGKVSVVGQGVAVQLDTQAQVVSDVVVGQDSRINLAQRSASVALSGQAEADADVSLQWRAASGEVVLSQSVRAQATGLWQLSLSAPQIDSLGQGQLQLEVSQTDAAGNTSAVITQSVWVDTLAPGLPDAAQQAAAAALNAQGELGDGVQWLDLQDGQLWVAVALPQDLGEGGSIKLRWGNQLLTHSVTSEELGAGVAQVAVDATSVVAQGDGAAVAVSASFVDALGNEGPWTGSVVQPMTVLAAQAVNLSDKPPQMSLSDSSYGRIADGVYYTRYGSEQSDEALKFLRVELTGLPNENVVIYEDRNGDGQAQPDESLARVLLDSSGRGFAELSLSTTAPGQAHVLRSFSTTLASEAQGLLRVAVDVQAPAAPLLDAMDTLINQMQRDALSGTAVSGSAEALADVSLSLINTRTGVVAETLTVRADANGQWQATLGLAQWAAVGDGPLRLDVRQTDWAGNTGEVVQQSLVLDSVVNAPIIQVISGNDQVGAAEALGLSIQGGAEAGASVTLQLAGSAMLLQPAAVRADSQGLWRLQLSADELLSLGQGAIKVTAQQTDVAGNVSSSSTRAFVLDTQVAAPSIDPVGGTDTLNAQQAGDAVLLSGTAEAGATLHLSASLNGNSLSWQTQAGELGQWQLSLSPQDIQTLGSGQWVLSVTQTDLAGNSSIATERALQVDLSVLNGVVSVNTISEDARVSWAEQDATLPISGDAPVGTQVFVVLRGVQGSLSLGPLAVSEAGQWQAQLSSEQMRNTLGVGAVRVDAWAQDPSTGQTTAANGVAEANFTLEAQEPMPALSLVAGDGVINAQEASAGVVLGGTGVAGHYVSLTLSGSQGSLSRTVQVDGSGNWSWRLSSTNVYALGEGEVAMALVQQDSASVSAQTSLTLSASVAVDTLAPQAPLASSVAEANAYNSAHALQGGVSYSEAAAGVQLAVPLHADAQAGDRLSVQWGSKSLSVTLSEADISNAQQQRYILVQVPGDLIAQAGSGTVDVLVSMSDQAGNVGQTLTLASAVAVQAPPQAPQIDAVMSDGYVNQSEYQTGVDNPQSLSLTGLSADGTVHVTLSSQSSGQSVSWSGSAQASAGVWRLEVPAQQLALLGEGRIEVSAYLQNLAQVDSPLSSSSFVFDRTAPVAPSSASQAQALVQVVKSELSGGLIAMADNGGLSEAYGGTWVPVALAADAQSGDQLLLYWGSDVGSGGTQVRYTLTQTDINNQFARVLVSQEVITEVGDSRALRVEAQAQDRAGNLGARYEVWSGTVDAVPTAPGLATVSTDGWVNLQESQGTVLLGGSADVGNGVTVQLTGSAASLSRTVTAQQEGDSGRWSLALDAADLAALGEGEVSVSVAQTDVPTIAGMSGNTSLSTAGSFIIDTVVPDAPQLDAITSDNRINYLEATQGVRITGSGEAGATLVLGVSDGSQTLSKSAVLVDEQGHWQVELSSTDLAGLSAGDLLVSAVQADAAGNTSAEGQRSVRYSNQIIAQPTIEAISGISEGDAIFNLADYQAAGQQMLISGTGLAGNRVRVDLNVGGADFARAPVVVDELGHWQVTLSQSDLALYGQGQVSVSATQIDAQTQDESLPVWAPTFQLDTVAPVLDLATLSANGNNGNAKAGDVIRVQLDVSEDITLSGGTPSVTLQLGDVALQALYDAVATQAAGANRLVFGYTVQAGDMDTSGGVSLASAQVDWQGAQVLDAAGNALQGGIALVRSNSIRVDTQAPQAPQTPEVVAQGANAAVTDASSPGGVIINRLEANDVRVLLSVDLSGTQAEVGDTLRLSWGEQTVQVLLSAQAISAQQAQVAVSATTIGATESTVQVRAQLIDAAGNVSGSSAALSVQVDTVAPEALSLGVVQGDERISELEAQVLQALGAGQSGSGDVVLGNVSAGTTLNAWLQQGDTRINLSTSTNAQSQAVILAGDLGQGLASLQDGSLVLGVSQTDAAGNESTQTLRNLYMDRSAPAAPTISALAQAQDGWINLADADAGVSLSVSLAGVGALKGDVLIIGGFGAPVEFTLTQAQIDAGVAQVSLPGSVVLQSADAPPASTDITASVRDQGGNISQSSLAVQVGWDTVIKTPVVDVQTGVAAGVGPAQSKVSGEFYGSGVEVGASVVVVMTGAFGDVLRFPTSGQADGGFSVTLKPSDFQVLGDGNVSYSVQQTDAAGNVSLKATGSFALALSLAPPTLIDVTGDNLINASEAAQGVEVSGIGQAGASVQLRYVGADQTEWTDQLSAQARSAVVNANGSWSVTLSAQDFSVLGSQSLSIIATQSADGDTSDTRSLQLRIDQDAPTLSATVTRADGNADGANNDALLITFSEAVKSLDVKALSNWVVSNGHTLGTGARMEALDEVLINGSSYASSYRLVLGANASLSGGDTLSLAKSWAQDAVGNTPALDQVVTVPSLAVPKAPVPALTYAGDNAVSAAELAAGVRLTFSHAAATAGSSIYVYVDNVLVKSASMGLNTTGTLFTLRSGDWGGDGAHQITAQIVDGNGATSAYSSPKPITLDTTAPTGPVMVELVGDVNGNGVADGGDVLRLHFNESVSIVESQLWGGIWGSGSTVKAVAPVNGFAADWDVTLGMNEVANAGMTVKIKAGTTDLAGNVAGELDVVLPDALVPPSVVIGNVSGDNVINANDRAASADVSVALQLTGVQAGDVVELYMDGQLVSTSAALAQGATEVSLSLADLAWGADGSRQLTAKLVSGQTVVDSTWARDVAVATAVQHWSQSGDVIWFDPDTLVDVADGGSVSSWQASVGSVSADQHTGVVKVITDASGHRSLVFDGKSNLWVTPDQWATSDLGARPDVLQGFQAFSLLRQSAQSSTWAYTFTFDFSGPGGVFQRLHYGVAYPGTGLTAHIANDGAGYLKATAPNSMTLNNWVVLGATLDPLTGNAVGVGDQILASRGSISSNGSGGHGLGIVIGSTSYANNTIFTPITGILGDQILVNHNVGYALRQDIAAYESIKYQSAGQWITTANSDGVYDLTGSALASTLIDQVVMLNTAVSDDVVWVAGADVVNTGAGSDRVILSDLSFRQIDGGGGRDVLQWANDYQGLPTVVLADYTTNAHGEVGSAQDNLRVNASGYHRLQGFEQLDFAQLGATGTAGLKQIVTIDAHDVLALSDTRQLEVTLGEPDVLLAKGFAQVQHGHWAFNGGHYDTLYTDAALGVEMYVRGGAAQPDLARIKSFGSALQLDFNAALYDSSPPLVADFDLQSWDGKDVPGLLSVEPINVQQGLYFSFAAPATAAMRVDYGGDLRDEAGRALAHRTWGLGTEGMDDLSAADWTQGAAFLMGDGNDRLVGSAHEDLLVGGLGADTLTGGAGSDRFAYNTVYADRGGSGGLGGLTGDVITDFNTEANSANADVLDLTDLFDLGAGTSFSGQASQDASTLLQGGFVDLVKTNAARDLQVWVDRDGGGAMGLLVTLQNVGDYTTSVAGESTEDLLQRLLTEGRMQVTHS